MTPELVEQMKRSGVPYQRIQRGFAEAIMTESVHPSVDEKKHQEKSYEDDKGERQVQVGRLHKFQEEGRRPKDSQSESNDNVCHAQWR